MDFPFIPFFMIGSFIVYFVGKKTGVTQTITSSFTKSNNKTFALSMAEQNAIINRAKIGLRESFVKEEGEKRTVYKDHLGYLTVGIGHLVLPEDRLRLGDTISQARVDQLFYDDVDKAFKAGIDQAEDLGHFEVDFIVALTHVNFQLGTGWTKKFPTTYNKLRSGDYLGAIAGLRSSLWYRQTPKRVDNFVNAIQGAFA